MPGKSEFAEPEQQRGVPRWIFEAWLWISVPAAALDAYGCPLSRFGAFCTGFSNTVGQAFELFPGTLLLAFGSLTGFAGSVACVALCALACHWIVRKTLPPRLSWGAAVALVAGWVAVSLATEYFAVWVAFHSSTLFGNLPSA